MANHKNHSDQEDEEDQWTGSVEQKIWGLMVVWSEAKHNFPFFDKIPFVNWDKEAQEYIKHVIRAEDLEAYYNVLRQFAALLMDGHTMVVPPWGFVKPGYDYPPVELQVVDNKFIVARTGDTDEIRGQSIYPGLEVLEVGEHIPVRLYLQENVLRFTSFNTPQANEAIGLIGLLSGLRGSIVSLKVRDPDGVERLVSLTRDSSNSDGTAFQWRWVQWNTSDQLIESWVTSDIVYMKISNFSSVKVVEEFERIFDCLDLSKVSGFILDTRYNSGGSSNHAYSIAGFFTDKHLVASKWRSLSYVPAHRSWNRPIEWIEGGPEVVVPRKGIRYLGPLVILTGPVTFSAAEDFLVPLKYSRRAVLVGEKTAGSTGNPIVVSLPGGGVFKVVSKRDVFPNGEEFVGVGISPDVELRPTQQDLLDGIDSVFLKGVEIIRNWV
jgi:carboxyl-terminal processing protease